MKRILIIANTYYQLIMAIQMRNTIFEKSEVVLLLSDHSNNAEKVCERLQWFDCFSEVHYIETKDLFKNRTIINRAVDLFTLALGINNRYGFCLNEIENMLFDEIIFYNYSLQIYGIFSILYRINKKLRISVYEESLFSYSTQLKENLGRKVIRTFRHLAKKKDVFDAVKNFYCFYPELYKGKLNAVPVEKIQKDGDCANILRQIFELNHAELTYPEKYIYFSSVGDSEGGRPIGELELLKDLAQLIGKDHLLVKVHPRDDVKKYISEGFKVDRNSSIPWESIQISGDFCQHVFLTAISTSVLTITLLQEKAPKVFYLYKMCDLSGNIPAKAAMEKLSFLFDSGFLKEKAKNIRIAENLEDILS